jgi:hypothetical protein
LSLTDFHGATSFARSMLLSQHYALHLLSF